MQDSLCVDDEVLAAHGVTDLRAYAPHGVADIDITPDFFVSSLRELRGLAAGPAPADRGLAGIKS